jgi:hypothetical protein
VSDTAVEVTHSWFETWNRGDLEHEVVSRMDWQVRGRASSIDTHLALTNVNAIVHGKIARQRHYLDHAEALRSVGLAP